MSFTQGSQTQTLSIQASNVFVFGGSVAAGNALTVQQLSTGSIASFQTVSGSTALFINSGGSVGIGLTNPSTALQVAGAITASAGFVGTLYGPIAGSNTIAASSMTLGTALAVAYGGTGTTTSTGSGSVVLSAGPSLTGTTTIATLNLTNALAVAYGGTGTTTSTGSGSVVLSAGPSLTGTTTIATLNLTNALAVAYGGTGTTTSTGSGSVVLSAGPTITGTLTCTTLSGKTSTFSNGDSSTVILGPNTTWAAYLYLGSGNPGNTVSGQARLLSTNGNCHLDAGTGQIMYLNYYNNAAGGTGGIQSWGGWSHNSNFTATGNITAGSDRRLKKNIRPIRKALDKVKRINGYTFERKDIEGKYAGVIAQEVIQVLPEVVVKDKEGMYSVAYGNITALLIEALKEETRKREELEKLVHTFLSKQ